MAIGDLNIVSLRPFSRSHVGAIADSINTAARLSAAAGPDEIVAANALFHGLSAESQAASRSWSRSTPGTSGGYALGNCEMRLRTTNRLECASYANAPRGLDYSDDEQYRAKSPNDLLDAMFTLALTASEGYFATAM
jgi:hypothetical protein